MRSLRGIVDQYRKSLGAVVLVTMTLPVAVLILVLTALSYVQLLRVEQQDVVEQLSDQRRLPVALVSRVVGRADPAERQALAELLVRPDAESLLPADTFVVRTSDGALVAGEPLPPGLWSAVTARGEGDGVIQFGAVLVSVRRVPEVGWTLMTAYPLHEVRAHAWHAARGLFVLAGVSVFGALVIMYVVIRRLVSSRLEDLAATTHLLAAGDRTVRAATDRDDELGGLAVAFNRMAETLASHEAVQARNAQELEQKVQERTAQLAAQARDLQRVLDAARQGFITIDLAGQMSPSRSRIVERWLGACDTNLFQEYVAFVDQVAAEWLEIGLQAVAEDNLPRELTLAQLPRRLRTASGVLDIEYIPIDEDGRLVNLLVVLTDVTGQIERERIEREQQEVVAIFQRISANPWSFSDFFDECKQMIGLLESKPPAPVALRIIHTLKGNCATFGITSMELVCHEAEDQAKVEGLTPDVVHGVVTTWHAVQARVRTLLPEKRAATISVSEVEYRALVERIREVAPATDLLDTLETWQLEPVRDRLETLADHARRLADRLGKGPLVVQVDAHDVRLEPARWSSFWAALQHAVRNAIDHGLESEPERLLAGKPSTGRLTLETTVTDGRVVIAVQDDGRGIPWDRVAERARAMGLPADTPEALEEALFVDGLSTRDVVTTISGRGVGMSALLAEVRARGGAIHIQSARGSGTRIEIGVPLQSERYVLRWSSAA